MTPLAPELDIVVWAPKAKYAREISRLSKAIFEAAAAENLHLAMSNLPRSLFIESKEEIQWDQDYVTYLRSCLMKPEHLDWMSHIWQALNRAAHTVLNK